MKVLTKNEVIQIHEASLRIIERVGMKIEHEKMLEILHDFGAHVDFNSMIVKFPRKLVEDCNEKQARKSNGGDAANIDYFDVSNDKLHRQVKNGVTTHVFCANISDTDTGEIRPATLKDLDEATIVANELENVGIGALVVPNDVPECINDAYMCATTLKRAKRRVAVELLNIGTIPYIYEMCCVAVGGEEAMRRDPLMVFPSFPSSPLAYSRYALDMAFKVIEVGMPVMFGCSMVVTGFTGPVTLTGTLTLGNAESLAGAVIAEAVGHGCFRAPGGGISSNQANGTALYTSPEKHLMSFALRDIMKFYGYNNWIYMGGHTNGSDACFSGIQAGIEKGVSSMMCNLGGSSCGLGGIVSPEVASLPQLVIDDEIMDFVNRISTGIKVDEETIACGLIEKLGIHGSFMNPNNEDALDHLVAHYREEHWMPKLFVRERPQQWQASKRDMLELAREKVRKILAENDPHPLGEYKEKEIDKI